MGFSGFMWVYVGCEEMLDNRITRRLELLTTRPPGEIPPPAVDFKGGRVVGFWPSRCRTTGSAEKKGSTEDSIEGMPRG